MLVCLFSWEWVDKLFITTVMKEFHIYRKYNYVKFKYPLFAASIHSTMGKQEAFMRKGHVLKREKKKKKRKKRNQILLLTPLSWIPLLLC